MFIIPNHGSEVLNRRDQRVFFSLEVARYLIDHAKGKKKPSGTQGSSGDKKAHNPERQLREKLNHSWLCETKSFHFGLVLGMIKGPACQARELK